MQGYHMSIFQDIKKSFRIEEAFDNWVNYRNTLTDYLIGLADGENVPLYFPKDILKEMQLPTLAIVGAGECNDIDLKRILPYFSKIALIDMDEEAMKGALCKYGLYNCDTIIVKPISLTGISNAAYEGFTDALIDYLQEVKEVITPKSFEDFAVKRLREQYENLKKPTGSKDLGKYDYVWCFGLHSQIQSLYGYIYHCFLLNLKHSLFQGQVLQDERFMDCLRDMNTLMIPEINNILLSMTKRMCVIGNEWDTLSDPKEAYYVDIQPANPIEGAYQGIMDIRNRDYNINESMIMWPFDKERNIYYEMLIQTIDKTVGNCV